MTPSSLSSPARHRQGRDHLRTMPALLAILVLVVVACGSHADATAVPPRTDSPEATPTPGRPTTSPSRQPTEEPSGDPLPSLDPPPADGPFEMSLYRRGDFVSQATKDWCTAAAMQIMVNIVQDGKGDATKAAQQQMYDLGRSYPPRDRGPGIPPQAWAAAMEEAGAGVYEIHTEPTRSKAIKAAARQLRLTGRPVGLVMWRGAHAWVMSGFKATGDPAFTDDYQVTGVWTEDPWYPRVSSIWGASNKPHTLVIPRRLTEDFLAWRRPTGDYPEFDRTFVMIFPVLEAPAA